MTLFGAFFIVHRHLPGAERPNTPGFRRPQSTQLGHRILTYVKGCYRGARVIQIRDIQISNEHERSFASPLPCRRGAYFFLGSSAGLT